MSEELYQEIILDHFKNPRCRGCLNCPHRESCVFNPLCGDKIRLSLNIIDGRVSEIAFEGEGCAISQASGSMMCSLCKGKCLGDVCALREDFLKVLTLKESPGENADLGDAQVLEGVKRFPGRVRCAVLAWEALGQCLSEQCLSEQGLQEKSCKSTPQPT